MVDELVQGATNKNEVSMMTETGSYCHYSPSDDHQHVPDIGVLKLKDKKIVNFSTFVGRSM